MFGILWFIIAIVGCIWAANDASKRGKSGCLVVLLVLFGGILGIIIWLIVRPEIEDKDEI